MSAQVTCERCGKTAPMHVLDGWEAVPEGWEGTIHEAVCPGCQYAEWHPHCLSPVTWAGEPVDLDWLRSLPPGEIDADLIRQCEYIDESVSVTDDDQNWPTEWECPRCGGTTFDWVHRDYPSSGLPGWAEEDR